MAVDFSAEPSPEGMELAAKLRRERRQRDKAAEDRIAAAEEQALLAEGRVSEVPAEHGVLPESDTEDDDADRGRVDEPQHRPVIAPETGDRVVDPATVPSIKDRLDELAAVSREMARTRSTDRQR